MSLAAAPIGVFDSGIGGLSVLQALRHELPHEHFVYVADSAHAPYGERGDAFVAARTHRIAHFLQAQHGIKALVIACNTATAAAVESLRQALPQLPLVGVEPALKPAAASSQTQHIGVMATRGTVHSQRFQKLLQAHGQKVQFHVQACDGLASAIEHSTLPAEKADAAPHAVDALCAQYVQALGRFGLKTGEMDTLVLGCTHYVFVKEALRALVGPDVLLLDTGAAVARQTRRLLAPLQALRAPEHALPLALAPAQQLQLLTTGSLPALQAAAQRWLQVPPACCAPVQIAL